jgi:hypothetical protein
MSCPSDTVGTSEGPGTFDPEPGPNAAFPARRRLV